MRRSPRRRRPRRRPSTTPALTDALETPAADSLAAGITEPNANFVWAGREVPEPFARWRDALAEFHPAVYRLVLVLAGDPAVRGRAARPRRLQRRLPARQAAVRGVRGGQRAAARARLAPEGGRLGGAGRRRRHARLGGAPALGLRALRHRGAQPHAARRRARRLPGAREGDARRRRQGRRPAALLVAVERAQPPVLLLAAARASAPAPPTACRSRPTSRSRRRCAGRSTRRPATSAT